MRSLCHEKYAHSQRISQAATTHSRLSTGKSSSWGNRYILVVADYFTRWTEAYPIPNQEATTVARQFIVKFVCRYGAPLQILRHQGAQFQSQLFAEMCQLLNIDKTRTSSYHPQTDGLVDRFNRTLTSMLSHFVNDHQKDWDD